MLLVIFGAGASYDSYASSLPPDNQLRRLPMANDLFGDRFGKELLRTPAAQHLMPRLRRAISKKVPIEQELESIASEAEKDPLRLRHVLSLRYYLKDVIATSTHDWHTVHNGATNYSELLDRLRKWQSDSETTKDKQVCFVTFNYDTMLDEAYRWYFNRPITNVRSYISDSNCRILKVHGSVDWLRVARGVPGSGGAKEPTPYEVVASDESEILLQQRYYRVDELPEIGYLETDAALIPALAIPTGKDKTFECPPEHKAVLRDALSRTTHVLAVGWRGKEFHFWKLWDECKDPAKIARTRILVVGGTECGTADTVRVIQQAEPFRDASGIRSFPNGFSNFLATKELENFLYDGQR